MRTLTVFNNVSLDGDFTDAKSDMSWAHRAPDDHEWNTFVNGNAEGGDTLLFGRVTYDMMASWWPTPMAAQMMPVVAARMIAMRKIVVTHATTPLSWENSTRLEGDLVDGVRALKAEDGGGIAIMGSGSIVAPLMQAGLIDTVQVVVTPVLLGSGRTMFDGLSGNLRLTLTQSRTFANGNVFLSYAPQH
jgi:dihydrofolate reductase